MRARAVAALVVIALIAGAIWWWTHRDGSGAPEASTEREPDDSDDFAFLMGPIEESAPFLPERGDRGERASDQGSTPSEQESREWPPAGPERERFREQMRERWRNMTPEERMQRFRERIHIEPLGSSEVTLTPDEVIEALAPTREKVRDCVRAHGGFRALREKMAAPDAGRRGPMTVSFDVSATGALEGLAFEPAPPEPFQSCFTEALNGVSLPPGGPEGARVEVQLGRGGRSRRPD